MGRSLRAVGRGGSRASAHSWGRSRTRCDDLETGRRTHGRTCAALVDSASAMQADPGTLARDRAYYEQRRRAKARAARVRRLHRCGRRGARLVLVLGVGIGFAGSTDRIADGVTIAGVDIGGMTAQEAESALLGPGRTGSRRPVLFVHGRQRFPVVPAELGVSTDWAARHRAGAGRRRRLRTVPRVRAAGAPHRRRHRDLGFYCGRPRCRRSAGSPSRRGDRPAGARRGDRAERANSCGAPGGARCGARPDSRRASSLPRHLPGSSEGRRFRSRSGWISPR